MSASIASASALSIVVDTVRHTFATVSKIETTYVAFRSVIAAKRTETRLVASGRTPHQCGKWRSKRHAAAQLSVKQTSGRPRFLKWQPYTGPKHARNPACGSPGNVSNNLDGNLYQPDPMPLHGPLRPNVKIGKFLKSGMLARQPPTRRGARGRDRVRSERSGRGRCVPFLEIVGQLAFVLTTQAL